jgi:trimeric autotransporter adhesin
VLQGYPETPSARWLTVHSFGCGSDAVMGLRLQQASIYGTTTDATAATAVTAAGATRRSVPGSNKRSSAPSDAATAAATAATAAATEPVGWPAEFVLQCSSGVRVCAHSAVGASAAHARSTMCLTVTYSSGLVVTLRSDGTVKQQYVSGSATQAQPRSSKALAATTTATAAAAAAASKGVRAVVAGGIVIIRSADGCETMLCPGGEVLRRQVAISSSIAAATAASTKSVTTAPTATTATTATVTNEDWMMTDRSGRQYKRATSSSKWELVSSANAVRAVRDAASGALCWCRADRSATVQFSDGSLLTRHSDGTTQRTATTASSTTTAAAAAAGKRVLVEAPGYASVEVAVGVQAASAAHAAGNTAAAAASGALSGSSTRLRVALPDGAAATVNYDARVTAAVRGSVGLVCADKTEVVVSDSGSVVVRPPQLWSGAAAAKQLAGPTSSMPNSHRYNAKPIQSYPYYNLYYSLSRVGVTTSVLVLPHV